ncbi:MAG: hypothetical protein AB7I50_05840, partial [Vicinamibacterales bacterium]
MRDDDRRPAALGLNRFSAAIHDVKIRFGQVAEQNLGGIPACLGCLFSRQPLQRPMAPHVLQRIGAEAEAVP